MIIQDIHELGASERVPRVVVIGSGAVGLYVASELAKRGVTVVVIESGGVPLDSFPTESYASVGRQHDGIRIGRSRSLGGTSNLWGGQLAEFQPVDFTGREWTDDSPWPISYEEIAPYYRRTYENLGLGDHIDDDQVWSHLPTGRPQLDEGLEVFLTRWLPVPSFSVRNEQLIDSGRTLLVLLNHTAVGFTGTKDLVTGVRVVDEHGAQDVVAGDSFVLTAGTIETARLLLHSAEASDWACPWRDNALIGARFQDHLGGKIAAVHPEDNRVFFRTFCNIVWASRKYQPKVRLRNETLESLRTPNVQGQLVFESSITENLVYLKQFTKAALYSRKVSGVGDLVRNVRACWKYLVPIVWSYAKDHRVFEPRSSRITLVTQAEHVPLDASRITIDRSSLDRHGLPRVVVDWRVPPETVDSIREFALRCGRALQAARLARVEIDADLLNRDFRFLDTLRDTNHQAGGAIMGASERTGVVDRDLRVFGTGNLYVGGAATFPTAGSANTTFTALALATRLTDHLSARHAQR
jgi:choline dehydrogenase-like flavoprotein